MKLIRRIAMQLPQINEAAQKSEKVSGVDMWKDGIKTVNGEPVELNKSYRKVTQVSKPVNHSRKMKAMYNKHGMKGIYGYAKVVTEFVNNQTPDGSH